MNKLGQTFSVSHLAPYVRKSYEKHLNEIKTSFSELGIQATEEQMKAEATRRTRKEVKDGVQTIQYQENTFSSSNGQTPFVSICLYIDEDMEYKYETAMIIEEILKQALPQAKILRMDRDTTRNKNSHQIILDAFANQQADILLGTQMIAKGLDFANVTLVGIINADDGLKRSDYRSVETTFELLVQASGRSGRANEGTVIMQVFDKDHYVIQNAINHDYVNFFYHEMQYRHLANYPPYSYLIAIYAYSYNDERAHNTIDLISTNLNDEFKVLGPTKLLKIKDEFRYRLIIKGKNKALMIKEVNRIINDIKERKGMANIKIDVDPMYL